MEGFLEILLEQGVKCYANPCKWGFEHKNLFQESFPTECSGNLELLDV